ncbi:hypothetical protein DFJ74DRAFT_673078 [Hyaloraphidium curvatum]|nr:hypothetical protein DFJ74DRAFT_673078 [Hyaloraphidium curvatum]
MVGRCALLLATVALSWPLIVPSSALRLVTFGDSLTDSGNIFNLTNGTTPSPSSGYYQGSFSDGPAWNLLASRRLGASLWDFAHGSATSDNSLVEANDIAGLGRPSPDVLEQVDMYRARLAAEPLREPTLHALFIGANNYYRSLEFGKDLQETDVTSFVNSTLNDAEAIIAAARRANMTGPNGAIKLAVLGMYPLELAPALNPFCFNRTRIRTLMELHDRLLRASLPSLPAETAFVSVRTPLMSANFSQELLTSACIAVSPCKDGAPGSLARAPFLWWDPWHLTSRGNEIISAQYLSVTGSTNGTVPSGAFVSGPSTRTAGLAVMGALWMLLAGF